MAVTTTTNPAVAGLADKRALRRVVAEQDARTGFEYDPAVTADQSRASALAEGIRPDENLLSRGIIKAREE
jgi:hypothetical protein